MKTWIAGITLFFTSIFLFSYDVIAEEPSIVVSVKKDGKDSAERTDIYIAQLSSISNLAVISRESIDLIFSEHNLVKDDKLSLLGATHIVFVDEQSNAHTNFKIIDARSSAITKNSIGIPYENIPSAIIKKISDDIKRQEADINLSKTIAIIAKTLQTKKFSITLSDALSQSGWVVVEREDIDNINQEKTLSDGGFTTYQITNENKSLQTLYGITITENGESLLLSVSDVQKKKLIDTRLISLSRGREKLMVQRTVDWLNSLSQLTNTNTFKPWPQHLRSLPSFSTLEFLYKGIVEYEKGSVWDAFVYFLEADNEWVKLVLRQQGFRSLARVYPHCITQLGPIPRTPNKPRTVLLGDLTLGSDISQLQSYLINSFVSKYLKEKLGYDILWIDDLDVFRNEFFFKLSTSSLPRSIDNVVGGFIDLQDGVIMLRLWEYDLLQTGDYRDVEISLPKNSDNWDNLLLKGIEKLGQSNFHIHENTPTIGTKETVLASLDHAKRYPWKHNIDSEIFSLFALPKIEQTWLKYIDEFPQVIGAIENRECFRNALRADINEKLDKEISSNKNVKIENLDLPSLATHQTKQPSEDRCKFIPPIDWKISISPKQILKQADICSKKWSEMKRTAPLAEAALGLAIILNEQKESFAAEQILKELVNWRNELDLHPDPVVQINALLLETLISNDNKDMAQITKYGKLGTELCKKVYAPRLLFKPEPVISGKESACSLLSDILEKISSDYN